MTSLRGLACCTYHGPDPIQFLTQLFQTGNANQQAVRLGLLDESDNLGNLSFYEVQAQACPRFNPATSGRIPHCRQGMYHPRGWYCWRLCCQHWSTEKILVFACLCAGLQKPSCCCQGIFSIICLVLNRTMMNKNPKR